MWKVISRNRGEINNYISDALLAIFASKESRQHALRAVSASLDMLQSMDEFKFYLKTAYGGDFDNRIGVLFGEIILEALGFGEASKGQY